ncbi:DUF397 domain-containing protein [Actinomadura bangladeshensis]|uniref:DUF397 domain-containing protein n=1 Tax=Actinomadura bangladeshensis TaxID=453573 RepID=A0A4R4PCY2_9ACTN|nr:DUF397 domain-containing protein [Actinomadura bangladeshensis]TDC19030.1 DUF397 domain-containing protein [Actinomadura bangladeshensis]
MSDRGFGSVHWRKSSYSTEHGTNCVEVAALGTSGSVGARDSKNPSGPVLSFTPASWDAFLGEIKRGAFDLA